jgi:hypothetical protein
MPFIQMDQILEQLPEGAVISRSYVALEGDIRVIVKLPGETFERRYTVDFEGGCPKIKEMR